MVQRHVEVPGDHGGLGPARGEQQRGGPGPDRGLVELVGLGRRGPDGLVARRGEHRGHPLARRPRAQQPAGRAEDVAAAVELDLGQGPAHLDGGRGGRAGQHGRRDERDGPAPGEQPPLRPRRDHQPVDGVGAGQPEQRDQQLGVDGRADGPGQQQVADPGRQLLQRVAELREDAGLGGGVRAEQGVDQRRDPRGAA
ncbi:hypothetical protein GCM10017691_58590 [Pseudonocardia petroleophila]